MTRPRTSECNPPLTLTCAACGATYWHASDPVHTAAAARAIHDRACPAEQPPSTEGRRTP